MEELPVITTWDLREGLRCGARARRRLDGNKGRYVTSARHNVAARIRQDVALAHSELRVATASDFPDPTDLLPEQRALYAAAANGYLTLFSEVAARTIDVELFRDLDDLGVQFRANPGVVLELSDGTLQVRSLRLNSRVPTITDTAVWPLALLWHDRFDVTELHFVAADLLALETVSHTINFTTHTDAAMAWCTSSLANLRALAAHGRVETGSECGDCPFIWNCPAHEAARR